MIVKKYISLVAAIIVQIALGGIYAYSIYVPELKSDWGFTAAQTQIVFGLTVFMFTVFMIYGGKQLVKKGPKKLIITSAILFATGNLLAAYSAGNYTLFFVGYVLFIAPAIAFGYVSAVSTGLLWFPKHKGLVTGLAVAGYGLGGIILSTVAQVLISSDMTIQQIFVFVGLVWGGAILVSGIVTSTPPGLIKKSYTVKTATRIKRNKKEFAALTIYLFTGTMPGLMMIGALKPFALDSGIATVTAAAGVAVLSFGNGFGRVLWGAIADVIKPRLAVIINMILIISSMLLLFAVASNPWLYIPASLLLGFSFGGPLVLAPDQTGRVFGASNLSQIYPWALIFHGMAAAVGASVAGVMYQYSGSYTMVIGVATISATIGLISYYKLVKYSRKLV